MVQHIKINRILLAVSCYYLSKNHLSLASYAVHLPDNTALNSSHHDDIGNKMDCFR